MFTRKRKFFKLGLDADMNSKYDEAIKYYEKSNAYRCLGNIYNCVPGYRDYNKALIYYQKYLDFELPDRRDFELPDRRDYNEKISAIAATFYSLGEMHYMGHGTSENNTKAKEYFEKSLTLGNTDSLFYLGQIYYYGYGVDPDYVKAKEYFERVSNHDSYYFLGEIYYYGLGVKRDYQEAKYYFKKRAHSDIDSILKLGQIYYHGHGVFVDYLKAKKYYDRALKLGSTKALYHLGCLYYYEKGLGIDDAKAKEYFEKGAELKCPDAITMLGQMYYFGDGVEKDQLKGQKYYEEATKLGSADAEFSLGCIYQNTGRLRSDFTKANLHFARAAEKGQPQAINDLGVFYDEKRDYKRAKQLYEESAKLNNPLAMINLANLLLSEKNQDGTHPDDMQKAIVLYVKAYQNSENPICLQKIHNLLDQDPNLSSNVLEYIRSCPEISDPAEKKRIENLQVQIIYRPGGSGYIEAKNEFNAYI